MKLRIVVLDCLYDTLFQKDAFELFGEIIGLKIRGYREEYPYGVLPIDTTDFIGCHQMVCSEVGGKLKPLMAYKSVAWDVCKTFNQPFSGLNLPKNSHAPEHAKAIEQIMAECAKKKISLSYDSSWTIDPEIRKDRELTKDLQKIMMALHVLYHQEIGAQQIIAGGVLRFKMERYYQYWGYERIGLNGKELEPIEVPFVFNEKTALFHLKEFSPRAIEDAQKYRFMWNARIEVARPDSLKKAA